MFVFTNFPLKTIPRVNGLFSPARSESSVTETIGKSLLNVRQDIMSSVTEMKSLLNGQQDIIALIENKEEGLAVFNVEGKIKKAETDSSDGDALIQKKKGGFADSVDFFSHYSHMGNVIYYATAESVPLVLKDKGAYHKPMGETGTFRSIEYKKVDRPLSELMDWHMNIIKGLGLSYHPNELYTHRPHGS